MPRLVQFAQAEQDDENCQDEGRRDGDVEVDEMS